MPPKPPGLQNLLVIWSALLISHFVLIFASSVVTPQSAPVEAMVPYVLAMAALSTAAISLILPKVLFKNMVLARNVRMVELPDPESLPGFGKTIRTAADPAGALRTLLPAYTQRVILGCALAESVTLFGFALKFLGLGWPLAAPFFVVGIVLCLLQMPASARYVAEVEAALGVRLGGQRAGG